jgi:elongation factor 1-gamma
MEVLHTSYLTKAKILFEDADIEDISKRNSYSEKTPTTTLPFLETPQGNISESISIETYLINKYKPDLLGINILERAKVNQWIEFASCEIQKCQQEIIFPIFNWKEVNKEMADKANKKLKQYIGILEKQLSHGKKYILGEQITLADIVLFRYLRFFMMLHFAENMRKALFPKLTKWFENIMNTPEAIEAYGRTILCKKQIKSLNLKIDRSKRRELLKKGMPGIIKEKNPLDYLPPSSFDLERFKNEFLEEKGNKDKIMEKFWKYFDPKGYSLWFMEYQNLKSEGKNLFRMINSKNFFLERIDEDFNNYAFGIHGVYGDKGDYKVRGVWLWRGTEIPKEIKENDYFSYMTIKNLKSDNDKDRQLVKDYWTKTNKGNKVDEKILEDFSYY